MAEEVEHIKKEMAEEVQVIKQEIEIDEYQCEFCSSVFEYEEDLDEHVLSHFHNFGDGETLPEKQTCRYCQKEYYALKYHIETNHPDKLSSKKSKKKDKKKDKRDKKGRKTLTCPVCNNEFKGMDNRLPPIKCLIFEINLVNIAFPLPSEMKFFKTWPYFHFCGI